MASLVGGVEDLVVEDGEVQRKTEADRVSGRQLRLGNLGGSLVGLERLVGRVLAAVTNGELGKVAVVVALPVCGGFALVSEVIIVLRHAAQTDILW